MAEVVEVLAWKKFLVLLTELKPPCRFQRCTSPVEATLMRSHDSEMYLQLREFYRNLDFSYSDFNSSAVSQEGGGVVQQFNRANEEFCTMFRLNCDFDTRLFDSFKLKQKTCLKLGPRAVFVERDTTDPHAQYVLHFQSTDDCEHFTNAMRDAHHIYDGQTTEYFHFNYLFNHRPFLEDQNRIEVFKQAMFSSPNFKKKSVLDVGCGLGTLSILAAKAGAKEVFAVDPSSIVEHTRRIVRSNGVADIIKIFEDRVEVVQLPSRVDTIVCNGFGEMLLHGHKLHSLLVAKKRFLRNDGVMFPSQGLLRMRAISDHNLFNELVEKKEFWNRNLAPGLLSRNLGQLAFNEARKRPYFSKTAKDLTNEHVHRLNFMTLEVSNLAFIEAEFSLIVKENSLMHGFAFSFAVVFDGNSERDEIVLDSHSLPTHTEDVICLLESALEVEEGDEIAGTCQYLSNRYYSYDILMKFEHKSVLYINEYSLEYGSLIAKRTLG